MHEISIKYGIDSREKPPRASQLHKIHTRTHREGKSAQTNKLTSPHTKCTHEHIFFVLSLSAPNKIGSREGEGELKMFTP